MTDVTITPTRKLEGSIKAPASKSYTIRAVIAGLLADGTSKIRDPLYSLDTEACIKTSERLGAKIRREDWGLEIQGLGGKIEEPDVILDTENSGTTIRLMTGIASLGSKEITLTGDESIQKRPIGELLDSLAQLGATISSTGGFPPHSVKGPLKGGSCSIQGDISSQFISSILMSAPYALNDTEINVSTPLKSKPYVDLTLSVMEHFGIEVVNDDYDKFRVPSNQSYTSTDYTVEGDYSSAAFMLSAAALTNGIVRVSNLFADSKQADKRIVDILEEMGADIKVGEGFVEVSGSGELDGVTMDLCDSPDLVPICAVLGSVARGKTIIKNVEHARLKECDRIHAMAVELGKMGVSILERRDGLEILGGALSGGVVIDSWHDHRIVMSMAVAGLLSKGETVINETEVSAVTYPDFFDHLRSLGASV